VLAWRQRVAGRGKAIVLPNCAVVPWLVFDHFKGLKLRLLFQRHGWVILAERLHFVNNVADKETTMKQSIFFFIFLILLS
jgi:hypothetical protein